MHKLGNIYSWNVINETTIVKDGDKSFFKHFGTAVPKEIKWYFSADKMKYGDRRSFEFIYQNKKYFGRLEIEKRERCRVFWHTDLGEQFRSYYHEETGKFPLIRFHKIENDKYEIEFIDEALVAEEKNEPYKTVLPQLEGKKKEYYGTKYERNPTNRRRAIEIHGTKCMICEFDFELVYGEAGRNLIEVHHTKPLHEADEEIIVNPETDLVCICANCHRIIHRRKDKVYTLEEVKRMINRFN